MQKIIFITEKIKKYQSAQLWKYPRVPGAQLCFPPNGKALDLMSHDLSYVRGSMLLYRVHLYRP